MVWHDMRLSKWWQNYHFGRHIPLSHLCSSTIKGWSLTAASYLPLQTVGAGGQTWFQEAGGCGPACGIFSGRFFGLRTRLREWHRCQVQQCRIATATNMQRHVCEKKRDQWVTEGQSFHSSGTFQRPRLHYESLFICLLLVRSVDVVTSISLWGRYGWKADSGVEVDGSPEKSSGDWVPVELALVPSPPTWGSCSSNTATNCREKQRQKEVFTFKRMKL